MAHLAYDAIENKVDGHGLITDHGNKADQDHYVKDIVIPIRDKNGKRKMRVHCVDVDRCDHTAESCADAVKNSIEDYLKIVSDKTGLEAEVRNLCGDRGGGANVKRLHDCLKQNGTMDEDSTALSCELHCLAKTVEVASNDAFGKQGMNARVVWQFLFLVPQIFKRALREFTREALDDMWAHTHGRLESDPDWQEWAMSISPQAANEYLQHLETLSEEDIQSLVKVQTQAPRNMKNPVPTRWGSVFPTNEFVVDNFIMIYFFLDRIKVKSKSGNYLWQLSCAFLSLANTRKLPEDENDFDIDAFIASFRPDQQHEDTVAKLNPGETPIFLAQMYFLYGFNKAVWNDMFNYNLRNDPILGKGSFGFLARFGTVRAICNGQASCNDRGGWIQDKQALRAIHDLSYRHCWSCNP